MNTAIDKVIRPGVFALPLLAVLGLSLWFAAPVVAEVYKWVDADGKIHYGDRPDDASAEEFRLKKSPDRDAGLAERLETQKRILDIYKEERIEQQEQRARLMEEKKQREENCQTARKRLSAVKTAGFLYERGANGERRVLSDTERTAAEQTEAVNVEHWCN